MKREHDTTSTGTVARPNQRRRSSKRKSKFDMKLINQVIDKRITGVAEKKFFDTTLLYTSASTTYPFDDATTFIDLSSMAQGIADNERTGDTILVNSVEVNYFVYSQNASGQSKLFFLRTTIFQWLADDSPIISDIVESVSALNNIISPWRHDTISIRKMYYNRVVTLFDDASAGTYRVSDNDFVEKEFIDLRKRPISQRKVQFRGGTTAGMHHIWLNITTNIPAASQSTGWNILYKLRLNYTDS